MTKTAKAIAFFSFAYLIIGSLTSFAQDSSAPAVAEEDKVFMAVEDMPQYQDGGIDGLMRFLSKELVYPIEARKNNIQGTVFISFIVEKDGKVTSIETVKGVDKMLDNEAARVVALTKWTPGKQDGKKVRTRFVLPISFKLED